MGFVSSIIFQPADMHATNEKPTCSWCGRKEVIPTKIAPSGKCYVVTDILKLAKIQVPKSQTHHRKEYFFVRNIVLRPL